MIAIYRKVIDSWWSFNPAKIIPPPPQYNINDHRPCVCHGKYIDKKTGRLV